MRSERTRDSAMSESDTVQPILRPRMALDAKLYSLYSRKMKRRRVTTKGVEEARRAFPALLDAAAQGGTTIITRRGVAVAAIVPPSAASKGPISLMSLAGSGKGLWGPDSATTVARMRDEWT